MSNRRNRRRNQPSPAAPEALERRQLLTGDTIGVQAEYHDILDQESACCRPVAVFILTDSGTGGEDIFNYNFTSENIYFEAYEEIYGEPLLADAGGQTSGTLTMAGGESIEVDVDLGLEDFDYDGTVTMSISEGCCCVPNNYTITPSSDTVTLYSTPISPPPPSPPTLAPCPFCPVGPQAKSDLGTGVSNPSSLSDAGVQYGTGAINPQSQSFLLLLSRLTEP